MAMALGSSSAGPMPCSARQTLNMIGPDTKLKPATSAENASHIHPIRYTFLWPMMSPIRPALCQRV